MGLVRLGAVIVVDFRGVVRDHTVVNLDLAFGPGVDLYFWVACVLLAGHG